METERLRETAAEADRSVARIIATLLAIEGLFLLASLLWL